MAKTSLTPAQQTLRQAKRNVLENKFLDLWRWAGGEVDFWQKVWIPGYQGHASKLELDLFNEATRVAVEVQGGQFLNKSGHKNPSGLHRDAVKLAKCNELGISLFHLTTDMVTEEWAKIILNFTQRRKP